MIETFGVPLPITTLPAIEARDVTKVYGYRRVLHRLNLVINEGEKVTIFGPNGSGKTTLLRIMATLSKPTVGHLSVFGQSVLESPASVRRAIGFVSHRPLLYDELSALENLAFFAKMYDVPRPEERARLVLNWVGLASRQHERVRTFSRGMQQRLSLAKALLHNPAVLLLDEPDTGIDQSYSVLNALLHWQNERKTVIMATHNVELGLDIADRILILANGRFIFDARRGEINVASFRDMYEQILRNGSFQAYSPAVNPIG